MPSASFNASWTTSVLRCSLSRFASGADSWLSSSVPPSTARTTAPANMTASERLRSRTLSRTVDHCLRIAAASGSPATGAAGAVGASTTGSAGGCTGGGDGGAGSDACGAAGSSDTTGSGAGWGVGTGAGAAGSSGGGCGGLGLADKLFRRLGRCAARGRHRARAVRGNRHVDARLDALDPLQQSRFRVAGRRQQQPRAHHFQQQPRRGRAPHLAETGVHDLGVAGQRAPNRCARPDRASAPARRRARRPRPARRRRAPPAARSDRGTARADRWRTGAGRGPRR